MKNVFLGLLMVAAMSISLGVHAEDSKSKKEAPKAETTTVKTTKAETTKAETTKSESSCCSAAPTTATCCSAAAKTTSCCSAHSADAKSDEKKTCGQIEKTISDKKTEAKKKK
jgi:hypothetical protein